MILPTGKWGIGPFSLPVSWAFNGLKTHLLEQYAGDCWSHNLTINFVERDEWVLRRCCWVRKRPWGQRNCPLESNSMVTRWADLKQEIYVFSSFLFALKGIITHHNEVKNIKTNAQITSETEVLPGWPCFSPPLACGGTLAALLRNLGSYQRAFLGCSKKQVVTNVPPSPADRQLYDMASISSLYAFNLKYNALYESWKWAWAGNQRDAAWKQREFTGGDGAGVASDGTGSSHTALVPRV